MNPKVKDAIQAAMDRCFLMNAVCDRMVYVMQGQWFMTAFAGQFHHKIAHVYPDWADKLGNILLGEGENVTRGSVDAQAQDYGTYSRPCFTLPSTALVDSSNALIES